MGDSVHESTQSGALIGSNDDLLTEILHRLLVTSILRFKSVSKHWKSLLSHRRFTLQYDTLSTSPGIFVHRLYIPFDVETLSPPPFRNLDFYPDLYGIRIVQSCNGLLLCCSDRGNRRARKYYVFNPTTKQSAIIPSVPGGQDVRKTILFVGLAFHQTDCVHYKVVCIHHSKPEKEQFRIKYTLLLQGNGRFQMNVLQRPFIRLSEMVFTGMGRYIGLPLVLIHYTFKLDVEKLQELPLPLPLPLPARLTSSGGYKNGNLPLYFGESRGHLHLVETANHQNCLHLNVYEMLSDNWGWFIKYQVELDELPAAYPEMINSYEVPSSPC